MTNDVEHVLVGGLGLGEELRWREGLLWFIDNWNRRIFAYDEDGEERHRIQLHFIPGGFGWLPDGTLVVADTVASLVWAVRSIDAAPVLYADLNAHSRVRLNGLCVRDDGTIYTGSIGVLPPAVLPSPSGTLIRIDAERRADVLCDEDLGFPNGLALSEDQRFLIVPESSAARLSIFDLQDPHLSRRMAHFPGSRPDGSCAARGDTFWFADVASTRCVLGDFDSRLHRELHFSRNCYAPMVNPSGDRLYVAIGDGHDEATKASGTSAIVWKAL